MFRNRRNSQKPNDELLAAFKQSFPGISSNAPTSVPKEAIAPAHSDAVTSAAVAELLQATTRQELSESEAGSIGINLDDSGSLTHHDATVGGSITPSRFALDQWRLTPSIFDPNAFSMSQMGGSQLGYYTPTPGGANTMYHTQTAGDLHTPGIAFQLGTPLSMSLADSSLQSGPAFDHSFNPHLFQQHSFDPNHIFDDHSQHHQGHHPPHPTHLIPGLLTHKDSGLGDNSPAPGAAITGDQDDSGQTAMLDQKSAIWPTNPLLEQYVSLSTVGTRFADGSSLRYHVQLNTQTAMYREDEIPVTYLNKGQAYTLLIMDSIPIAHAPQHARYRTSIRVSFEEPEQRQRPGHCWFLWKEGRGLLEAHQRGGKLQAVEYVDPHPGAAEDDPRKPRIKVERESFDGFTVDWSPAAHSTSPHPQCSIAVRFNFLSTDFSHSKGVKGIPVRLCAKTYMLPGEGDEHQTETQNIEDQEQADKRDDTQRNPPDAEVAYCKVKLFRDHGAERKLTNDIAHVKKSIDKLNAQKQQLESGIKESGRKKRTSLSLGKIDSERPTKLVKHKRTWSVSSTGSGGRTGTAAVGKSTVEEDLDAKLKSLQAMFKSSNTHSVFFLRGEEGDDMDKHPVSLGDGDSTQAPTSGKPISLNRTTSNDRSESGSTQASPFLANKALPKLTEGVPSTFAVPAPPQKVQHGAQLFEAVEVHPEYRPPQPTIERAVACLYAKKRDENEFYKAVYLWSRSKDELFLRMCHKFNLAAHEISRMVRVTPTGIEVEVDDETIQQTDEGQAIEFELAYVDSQVKTEAEQPSDRPPDPFGTMLLRLFY